MKHQSRRERPTPARKMAAPHRGIPYNDDLKVSVGFRKVFPDLRELLLDERLILKVRRVRRKGEAQPEAFSPLRSFTAFSRADFPDYYKYALDVKRRSVEKNFVQFVPIFEFIGLFLIGLMFWTSFRNYRRKWCCAMFCRERLRQSNFQLFLDGHLLEISVRDPHGFLEEVDRRWSVLIESINYRSGTKNAFGRYFV